MQLKDKKYIRNLIGKISGSVGTMNAKILLHKEGVVSIESVLATAALEQLAMQHEILLLLSILVAEPAAPGSTPEPLPEVEKKIIGFN